MPLLIQENYLNHKPAAGGNELQHMKVLPWIQRAQSGMMQDHRDSSQLEWENFTASWQYEHSMRSFRAWPQKGSARLAASHEMLTCGAFFCS